MMISVSSFSSPPRGFFFSMMFIRFSEINSKVLVPSTGILFLYRTEKIAVCALVVQVFSSPPQGFFSLCFQDLECNFANDRSRPLHGDSFSLCSESGLCYHSGWKFSSPPRGFFFSIISPAFRVFPIKSSRPLHGDSFSLWITVM